MLDSYVPGLHGCFVSQNGWLALSWYFPLGQISHAAAFALPEKLPAAHGVQTRSDVAVPSVPTRVPAAHEAWSTQNVLPVSSWNCPSLHAVHASALERLEKLPPRQLMQRSGAELVVLASYMPGLHGCFASQNG